MSDLCLKNILVIHLGSRASRKRGAPSRLHHAADFWNMDRSTRLPASHDDCIHPFQTTTSVLRKTYFRVRRNEK